MSAVRSASTRRPSRDKSQHRRQVRAPDRPTRLESRRIRDRPARRSAASRIGAGSGARGRDTGNRLPRRIELVQSTVLVALAVLAITLVLPALLGLAAAPSR